MPNKRTTNYQLSQWEAEDKVLRTDFNEDNAKLDEAIKAVDVRVDGKADASVVAALQSTLSTLQSTVEKKQDASGAVQLKVGTYTGKTSADSSGLASGSQTISVGFKPKAVLVFPVGGDLYYSSASGYVYGGLAVTGSPAVFKTHTTLELTDTGFTAYTYWTSNGYSFVRLNEKDQKYHYIALG